MSTYDSFMWSQVGPVEHLYLNIFAALNNFVYHVMNYAVLNQYIDSLKHGTCVGFRCTTPKYMYICTSDFNQNQRLISCTTLSQKVKKLYYSFPLPTGQYNSTNNILLISFKWNIILKKKMFLTIMMNSLCNKIRVKSFFFT